MKGMERVEKKKNVYLKIRDTRAQYKFFNMSPATWKAEKLEKTVTVGCAVGAPLRFCYNKMERYCVIVQL